MTWKAKDIVEVITCVVLVGGGIYAFGVFNGRLDQLEKRETALENRVDPLRDVKVGKGDLCLQMLKELNTATGDQQKNLQTEYHKSGCEGLSAASRRAEADGPIVWTNASQNATATAD